MKIDCNLTINYLVEKARMVGWENEGCGISCNKCPLSFDNNKMNKYCTELETFYPETAIDIVQKWSNSNQTKTRAEKFFEKFPNAKNHGTGDDKMPNIAVCSLNNKIRCTTENCSMCWLEPYEEGEF